MKERRRWGIVKNQVLGSILLIIFVAVYILFFSKPHNNVKVAAVKSVEDTVTVLNVGNAECSLINSGGVYCVIDTGESEDGQTKILEYLKAQGVEEIELIVLTHFHSDHTSQTTQLLKNFKVNNLLIPNLSQDNIPTSRFFEILLERADRNDFKLHTAKKGDRYKIGKGELLVIDDTINNLSINDTSVATLFVQGDFSYLNTGDGERQYEEQLSKIINQNVTLFKAGHHGSSTSNTWELLNVIKPKFVAISASKDNEYGHPHNSALRRLEKTSGRIDITYEKGDLVYSMKTNELLYQ